MLLHIGDTRYIPVDDILMFIDADALTHYNKYYKTVILTERASHLSTIGCVSLKKRLDQSISLFKLIQKEQ